MNKAKVFVIILFVNIIIGIPFAIKTLISENFEDVPDSSQIEEDNEIEVDEVWANDEKNNETGSEVNTKTENVWSNNNNNQATTSIDNKKNFQKVEKSYFDDALFIGDSRTVGIAEYGDIKNATFFANTGMSIYNVQDQKVEISGKKVKLDKLLSSKEYGKIYIMLGINEIGYDINNTVKKYKEFIEYIKNKQNKCIIYVEANLHVTEEKSNSDKIINNERINKFNNKIAKLADNKKVFYLDINTVFDDKNGNLRSDYTHDSVHVYAKYYREWSNWLAENAIV